jgi:hypothetical protein
MSGKIAYPALNDAQTAERRAAAKYWPTADQEKAILDAMSRT